MSVQYDSTNAIFLPRVILVFTITIRSLINFAKFTTIPIRLKKPKIASFQLSRSLTKPSPLILQSLNAFSTKLKVRIGRTSRKSPHSAKVSSPRFVLDLLNN